MAGSGASSSLPRAPAKVRSQTDLPTLALARQQFLGQGLRVIGREPMISSVAGRQIECLPNMIQPPLLGVVKAASAVSARTLTWRAPAVPRSCSMLSVYMAVRRRPVPRLPPLEAERVRSFDPDIAGIERKGVAALDAAPLESLQEELRHRGIAIVTIVSWRRGARLAGPAKSWSGKRRLGVRR